MVRGPRSLDCCVEQDGRARCCSHRFGAYSPDGNFGRSTLDAVKLPDRRRAHLCAIDVVYNHTIYIYLWRYRFYI